MSEAIITFVRESLPKEIAASIEEHIAHLESADFDAIFQDLLCQKLLGHDAGLPLFDGSTAWNDYIFENLEVLLAKRDNSEDGSVLDSPKYKQHFFFVVAVAALGAFLQSNVTGPPLPFLAHELLFPQAICRDAKSLTRVRKQLLDSFRVDGEAPYSLTPNIELLALADTILTCPPVAKNVPAARWARLRVDFLHQRILSESSPTIERIIYDDLESTKALIASTESKDIHVSFLLECATIHTFHGHDKLAKECIKAATMERHFEYAITGMMGKRTKFQQKDTSQLVVLAKSDDEHRNSEENGSNTTNTNIDAEHALPQTIDLNDDTLLEKISFTKPSVATVSTIDKSSNAPQVEANEFPVPPRLRDLDPDKQPILDPLDSIILLSEAASITNTNPADGLTREETAPYAIRVLEGGSSNWQVYTHALLLKSRIEGYKSRTVERSLLQLQALVDQVIADTGSGGKVTGNEPTTFLPKPKESESAPADQRLLYIFALASPTRWELEAELAARWVSLGGLRSALDIYKRLEMWAEAALCYAATDNGNKARNLVRKQLFHATTGADESADHETEEWRGAERDPPPSDAPRLYCILGDIDADPSMYEEAWRVSNERYSRAQRSLGRYYYGLKDYAKASLAYSKSLKVKALDHGTWFAQGCAFLELEQFRRAVEAFSRAVQIDYDDAESWSNMAAALLNLGPDEIVIDLKEDKETPDVEGEELQPVAADPQKNRKAALKALKQAARLKQDNHRIWDNLLTVAASLQPPSWSDMLLAQSRIIDMRGPIDGEKCIDVPVLSALINHVMTTNEPPSDGESIPRGLPKMTVDLVERKIVPLITASAEIWRLLAKLALWRNKPGSALEAHEKAWRIVSGQPGWEQDTEKRWDEVVDATIDLVGAYESLGSRTKTEGLGAGEALVAKDWKFKARSAIRGIKGRGKDSWEGTAGWERLDQSLEELKS